jgi:hypothetical protein
MNAEALLAALSKDQLVYEASPLVAWELGGVETVDDVAEYMYKGGRYPPQASVKSPRVLGPDRRPPKTYWDCVKSEFRVFLCSPDQRYSELWSRLGKIENQGTTAIVSVISAYMGNRLGIEAGVISGFVAVCLYGALKIGKEALCKYLSGSGA